MKQEEQCNVVVGIEKMPFVKNVLTSSDIKLFGTSMREMPMSLCHIYLPMKWLLPSRELLHL
jgi:hypothetical protein